MKILTCGGSRLEEIVLISRSQPVLWRGRTATPTQLPVAQSRLIEQFIHVACSTLCGLAGDMREEP